MRKSQKQLEIEARNQRSIDRQAALAKLSDAELDKLVDLTLFNY